ncbi:alcohol dehydrogenase class-3 [Chytriomyces sp. MP71]|nr:alcohol dehydrogenase class-3 [Chytriomyces sp. MP71]
MSIQAIKIKGPREAAITETRVPTLRDEYILVKTAAVALNPTDWKHIDYLSPVGSTVGCDWAGTVLQVGSKVTRSFKVGDRVWGLAHGSNSANADDGTFATIITVKDGITLPIPSNLSFEEASTLGVGIYTVGQGLYQTLGLELPSANPTAHKTPILIYGGSTATGALAIQFAKASGYTVLTTASPRNFDYLTRLGADKVFDYNSATVAADIRAASNGGVTLAFDCVSEAQSPRICAESFRPEGGKYSALLTFDAKLLTDINVNVKVLSTLAYTATGESVVKPGWGLNLPANLKDYEFAKNFGLIANELLASGKVKVHTPSVNEGGSGLEGVLKGLQLMREGKVSGKKLVYTL